MNSFAKYLPNSARTWLGIAAICLITSTMQPKTVANGRGGPAKAGDSGRATHGDPYGGLPVRLTAPTGYFRVVKSGDRWMLATPRGNAFWILSVYVVDPNEGGDLYNQVGREKYGASGKGFPWRTFATQAVRRLQSWGFNTLGEWTSTAVLPVPSHGSRTSDSEKMPFIWLIRPSDSCLTNRWGWATGPVKDLIFGTDRSVYTGWRGSSFPDIFDPNFAATVQGYALETHTKEFSPIFQVSRDLDPSPWLIGTATDDADDLFGFKRSTDENLAWIAAVTSPNQSQDRIIQVGPRRRLTLHYPEATVYTKLAWRDSLRSKYGTLAALNAAWGSRYTSWDSDGGWPDGSGLLDESGRHRWVGRDFINLSDTSPGMVQDLNAFLEIISAKYFSTVASAIREATPHHLVFGPVALQDSRPEIVRGAAPYLDVFEIHITPGRLKDMEAIIGKVYADFHKPILVWTTFTSQEDSPLAGSPNVWKEFDLPTQAARGLAYASYMKRLFDYRAPDGMHPVIGMDWWSWTDKIGGGERSNFGLVTNRDNAYDGKEDTVARWRDPWGYATGGEARNYGDFLSSVQGTNLRLLHELTAELSRETAAPAAREIQLRKEN